MAIVHRIEGSGILTTNIINYLGGLENCRMFKISGVREAFKEINRKGALSVSDIIKIIGTNWKPEHAELVVNFTLGRPLTPAKTFQHLVDEKLLRPGLNFVCKQCLTEKWYGMNEFTDKFSCPYCFTEQDIPRVDKLHWHYKTNGILGLSGVGFGTMPVIVSLWRYTHIPTCCTTIRCIEYTLYNYVTEITSKRQDQLCHKKGDPIKFSYNFLFSS